MTCKYGRGTPLEPTINVFGFLTPGHPYLLALSCESTTRPFQTHESCWRPTGDAMLHRTFAVRGLEAVGFLGDGTWHFSDNSFSGSALGVMELSIVKMLFQPSRGMPHLVCHSPPCTIRCSTQCSNPPLWVHFWRPQGRPQRTCEWGDDLNLPNLGELTLPNSFCGCEARCGAIAALRVDRVLHETKLKDQSISMRTVRLVI